MKGIKITTDLPTYHATGGEDAAVDVIVGHMPVHLSGLDLHVQQQQRELS
jgi:hypothetical protein